MARPMIQIPAGTRFGKLTVISAGKPFLMPNGFYRSSSVVKCECGTTKTIRNGCLKTGLTISCGCWVDVAIGLRVKTHGLSTGEFKPEYTAWANMMRRYYATSCDMFERYGGRGISVCDEWHNVETFIADMGKKPSARHSLDRIDNDGNYEKTNCRWSLPSQQSANRSTTKLFSFNGKTQCIKHWANEWNVSRHVAKKRLEQSV